MAVGKHRQPKPSPYTIAAGAVAYSLAVTFHKNLPPDLIASIPAAVAVGVNAIERAVSEVDPKAAPKAEAIASHAETVIKAAVADVQSGSADAAKIEAEVKPLIA